MTDGLGLAGFCLPLRLVPAAVLFSPSAESWQVENKAADHTPDNACALWDINWQSRPSELREVLHPNPN